MSQFCVLCGRHPDDFFTQFVRNPFCRRLECVKIENVDRRRSKGGRTYAFRLERADFGSGAGKPCQLLPMADGCGGGWFGGRCGGKYILLPAPLGYRSSHQTWMAGLAAAIWRAADRGLLSVEQGGDAQRDQSGAGSSALGGAAACADGAADFCFHGPDPPVWRFRGTRRGSASARREPGNTGRTVAQTG